MRILDCLGQSFDVGDRILYAVGDRSAVLRDATVKEVILRNTTRRQRMPDGTYQDVPDVEAKIKVATNGTRWNWDEATQTGQHEPYTYSKTLEYMPWRFVRIPEGLEVLQEGDDGT